MPSISSIATYKTFGMLNAPLKVLHISNAMSWRGGEQQIAYMVEELAELGVEQMMVVAQNSRMHEYCRQKAIRHIAVTKRWSVDPGVAKKINTTVKQFGAHLLHAHDAHAHTSCLLAYLLFGCRIPLILHRRVDFPIGQTLLSRYKYNHSQVAKIICVSEAIQQVIEPVITNKDKLTIVHSGVDAEKFYKPPSHSLRQEFGISTDVKLVGNSAALTGHKDYFTFLRTAQKIIQQQPRTCFAIIGDGELYDELLAYRDELGLTNAVIFTGFRNDITDILPELDVLLFTSEMEGLGTTVLDAYAAGVPVVATRAGGVPEMAEEGQSALVADVKDVDGLAHHVVRLLQEPDLRPHLIANGYRMLQHFTKEQMANHIFAIYRQVVNQG